MSSNLQEFNNRQERQAQHAFFYNVWRMLAFNGIRGDYVEFGCWSGMTFAMSYSESRRQQLQPHFWAFDSFEGLPAQQGPEDEHQVWVPGLLATSVEDFHAICARNNIPQSDYTTVEGFYDQTLDKMAADSSPTDIALAYIDCDLYSSTVSVLSFLKPRLKHGMVVVFDDYFCFSPGQLAGERRAMLELLANDDRWHLEEYARIGWYGKAFVVEDKRLLQAVAGQSG